MYLFCSLCLPFFNLFVYSFSLDGIAITLNGSSLCMKPSERAVKKWKKKPPFDL